MERIKVYTTHFIDQLSQRLQNKDVVNLYETGQPPVCSVSDTKNTILEIQAFPKLDMEKGEFENAKILYESLIGMNRTMASDQRLWAWLAHAPFMDYMSKRWPVSAQSEDKKAAYIARHWFVMTQASTSYMRHGIAMLWWGTHVTYDPKRDDPFELTKELFSMQDYTRTIFGLLGRSDNFTRAVLEFVVEDLELFKSNKEAKVRFLMRKLNYASGYKVLPGLSKDEIKKLLGQYKEAIAKVTDE